MVSVMRMTDMNIKDHDCNCHDCRFRVDSDGFMPNDEDPWPIYECGVKKKRLYDTDMDDVKENGCIDFGHEGYLSWGEVEKKYGKEIADKMSESQYMHCITMLVRPNGESDIPERDIDLAYRDVKKHYIHPCEWD